jgi:TetR/AcrR family transcriptional repressor of nem operon
LVEYYLSDVHRDNPGYGCPVPSLAAEEARQSVASRESFTRKYTEIVNVICKYVPGETAEQRENKVQVMFASLTGAIALARAVSDPELSDRILATTKEHLIAFVTGG